MILVETIFKDAFILQPKIFGDTRGFFMESYNKEVLKSLGIDITFIQDNHSLSQRLGTLRGLHYQLSPKEQTKLIRVTRGKIYDVILDIRKNSPTYGNWQGFYLDSENKDQLLVPKGFAHGFCTLAENTEVQYKVDQIYSPEHDRGIAWNDPELAIDWPISEVFLSEKDKIHPTLKNIENGVTKL